MTPKQEWRSIGPLSAIPQRGARRLGFGIDTKPIAVFRTATDQLFAVIDECPHRGGPLSEGIVCGTTVTCPLHHWVIDLSDGVAVPPDEGATMTIPIRVIDGEVFIEMPRHMPGTGQGGAGER
ncbi:MAG: nitrite reductase (NAD(P)H) small subunit [Azospirillaceae bacterium]|nr:nitrite reductase (NAD(P)H) small subunit [Azospirillaceae bacterium]